MVEGWEKGLTQVLFVVRAESFIMAKRPAKNK